jgi:DNA polymerase delta subunit 1
MYIYVYICMLWPEVTCHLCCRGQSIKVFSQLLRKARQKGFILPFMKQGGAGAGGAGDAVGYEGATVLEPKIGEHGTSFCGVVGKAGLGRDW